MKEARSLIPLSMLLLAACGSDEPKDVTAPTAAITFPSTKSFTGAATARIVGTAADTGGAVTAVTINGQPVTTTDNFANWSIDVDLVQGANSFVVSATDAAGNVAASAATASIERRSDFQNISGAELDSAGEKVYFLDAQGLAIRSLTLADRTLVDVADLSRFAGTPPLDLALDLANNRIFVGVRTTSGNGNSTIGVWAFNTQTRTWSAFSDAQTPANGGPALANPTDLVVDSSRQRLYVVDWPSSVYSLNLTNGQRTLLSSNTVPNTANGFFIEPMDAALDSTNGRLLIIDRGSDALFSVDVNTGVRTLISRSGFQTGPAIGYPLSMVYSATANSIYTFDGGLTLGDGSGIMNIDLATGTRSVLMTNANLPTNAPDSLYAYDVRGLVMVGSDLIGVDSYLDSATRTNTSTGARTLLASNGFPRSLPVRPSNDTVYAGGKAYFTTSSGELYELASDGTERLVAGTAVTGSAEFRSYAMTVDAASQTAYGATYENGDMMIRRVNLATGAVTLIADGTVLVGGQPLDWVYDIAFDSAAGKLYLLTPTKVQAVTISSGARQVLSAANPAVPLNSPRQLALDTRSNRILVAAESVPSLVAVDLTSGAHTAVSDASASGAPLTGPTGVAVDTDGAIWVIDDNSLLVRVDRQTGARTQVSATSGSGSGAGSGALVAPSWYGVSVDGSSLLIHDDSQSVLQVERASGARLAIVRGGSNNGG